ncbi:MAG: hypothetical protein ABL967_10985 [Bryobacteraceae bacterium]
MPRFRVKGTLTRNALADLWKHTLSRIPTVTGRLVYLASLRDANSGQYKHHGLAAAFGRDESTRALQESHEKTFAEWLEMSLEERAMDLRLHITAQEDAESAIAEYWMASDQVTHLIPSGAYPMERELFQQDLRALLQIIRNSNGGAPQSRG